MLREPVISIDPRSSPVVKSPVRTDPPIEQEPSTYAASPIDAQFPEMTCPRTESEPPISAELPADKQKPIRASEDIESIFCTINPDSTDKRPSRFTESLTDNLPEISHPSVKETLELSKMNWSSSPE